MKSDDEKYYIRNHLNIKDKPVVLDEPEVDKLIDRLIEDYRDPKHRCTVEEKFNCVDKLYPVFFSMIKKNLENEINRELTDYEAEQIFAFLESSPVTIYVNKNNRKWLLNSVSTPPNTPPGISLFFRQFSDNEINSSEYIELKKDYDISHQQKCNISKKRNVLFDSEFYHNEYLEYVKYELSEETIRNLKKRSDMLKYQEPASKKARDFLINSMLLGKISDVNYPVRHRFKKQKFSLIKLIKNVILWWKN